MCKSNILVREQGLGNLCPDTQLMYTLVECKLSCHHELRAGHCICECFDWRNSHSG